MMHLLHGRHSLVEQVIILDWRVGYARAAGVQHRGEAAAHADDPGASWFRSKLVIGRSDNMNELMGPRRYTIKQLPPELRPRERLLAEGPEALSSAELLGILFGIGSREKTAVELASEVISENGDLFGLYNASVQLPNYEIT